MKILVTGGAGFIGSHIVELLLSQQHTPVVLDNFSTGSLKNLPPGVKIHQADICDRDAVLNVFLQEQPDVVCHQAAQMSVGRSVHEPSFDATVNILGMLNVLESSQKTGVKRVVFASSGGVLYGSVTEPATEAYPANPISPYGISKWAGERYLQFFTSEHQLETVALRYSNVYGPRQNPHGEAGVVAIFCQRMLRGEPTTINGDGQYIRDYVYVTDVANANILALTRPLPASHLPLNIGTGIGVDVNELAIELRTRCQQVLTEKQSDTLVPAAQHGPARPGDLRSNLVNSRQIRELWNWEPAVTLQPGLEQTVRWFAEQIS